MSQTYKVSDYYLFCITCGKEIDCKNVEHKNCKIIKSDNEDKIYYVNDIEFNHDGQLDAEEVKELQDEYCCKYYSALDEENLNDKITFKSGWLVDSIDATIIVMNKCE